MKKLNNKGITLVELIVSFALVSVSVIYFYQTVYTVRSLYSESQKDTQHYVKANYALRLADEYYTTGCKEKTDYKKNVFLNAIDPGTLGTGKEENFCYVTFKVDGKQYKLYKEPIVIKDASPYGYDAMLIGDTNVLSDGTNKYFSFDGDGDFIQLPSLPGCSTESTNPNCINWKQGFIVEFKARYAPDNTNYRRIIDFSNGMANNNIYITSQQNTIQMGFGGRNSSDSSDFSNSVIIETDLTQTQIYKAEFIYDENTKIYTRKIYVGNNLVHNSTSSVFWSNDTRNVNYIGYSPWVGVNNDDKAFMGDIYYVKIDAYVGNNTTVANGAKQRILDINANNFED